MNREGLVSTPSSASWARANDSAKTIRHQASSIATTPSRVLVKFPRALYSRITIKVAAGAVAEDIAPKRIATGRGCARRRYKPAVTRNQGRRAAVREM